MRAQHFGSLVLTLASAAVLASPALSEAVPFFGSSRCKDEKARLHHEEKILRDRQRLALHQCEAGAGSAHGRCEGLERQQKAERKQFKEREKRAVKECQERGEKRADKDEKRTVGKRARSDKH